MLTRKLTSDDASELLEFYRRLGPETREVYDPFPNIDHVVVATHLLESEAALHLSRALLEEDVIAGHSFVMRIVDRNPIFGIGVAAGYQGKGHGLRLASEVIGQFDRVSRSALTLTVLKRNEPAVSMYRKLGFTVKADHTFRTRHDSFVMVREP